MFNSIYGTITEKNIDTACIDTGSIEWLVSMSNKSLEKMRINEKQRIYLYLQHTENAMSLFGFVTLQERNLFLDLLKVNGIGPKQAIKILSHVETEDFIHILESGDAERLKGIPGVGKTTAQKIMLTLQGKLTTSSCFNGESSIDMQYADICTALVQMGFDRRSVRECVNRIVKEQSAHSTGMNENEILREAIVQLSSR